MLKKVLDWLKVKPKVQESPVQEAPKPMDQTISVPTTEPVTPTPVISSGTEVKEEAVTTSKPTPKKRAPRTSKSSQSQKKVTSPKTKTK